MGRSSMDGCIQHLAGRSSMDGNSSMGGYTVQSACTTAGCCTNWWKAVVVVYLCVCLFYVLSCLVGGAFFSELQLGGSNTLANQPINQLMDQSTNQPIKRSISSSGSLFPCPRCLFPWGCTTRDLWSINQTCRTDKHTKRHQHQHQHQRCRG